jgi:hypothetical protein
LLESFIESPYATISKPPLALIFAYLGQLDPVYFPLVRIISPPEFTHHLLNVAA